MINHSDAKKRSIQLLPNAITALGLSCGLFVIFKVALAPNDQMSLPLVTQVSVFLLVAAIADLLDGAVARMMKLKSSFGGLFDSLADAISFGVAPTVVVLKTFHLEQGTFWSFLLTSGSMIYAMCGIIRLVRFSLGISDIPETSKSDTGCIYFEGLPIPSAAACVMSANLCYLEFQSTLNMPLYLSAGLFTTILLCLGYLMVSQVPFPSVKSLNFHVTTFPMIALTVAMIVLLFYGILYYFSWVFFIFAWLYMAGSLLIGLSYRK